MNLSASHRNLDLDRLEQISVGAHSVVPGIVSDDSVRGVVVLATCNRFEVYLDAADEAAAADATVAAVAAQSGLAADEVRSRLSVRSGEDVVQHLFTVAAGLDSMVVGEREVAGQVRRALDHARTLAATSSDLEALFQGASRVSRAVARRTGLAAAGRSVVSVALDLAEERRPVSGARVLLVGTGSYAGASAAALVDRGARVLAVYSPSGRAEAFAATHEGLEPVGQDGLADALATADLVVACSGSGGTVIGADDVARARSRGGGPAVLVDLALRRDVDPAVADLPGVHLVDLAAVARHAPESLGTAVEEGRVIVEAETARLLATFAEREATPAVRAVRAHVESALLEVAARYPDDPQVQRALHQFAASLLHQPVNRARSMARIGRATEFEQAMGTFLGLEVEPPA
ncbi:glutamyl-tRNA reductase [Isoptericola sp. b490]|uniref:glutamyl-tRNA reductase n=1 Tax=Actinotalea lenta TaxID=3064654 RepID=UPI002713F04A|nr:glutamyl-tRNA reductase [Isoptericola sp. b490]MDO8122048.1 glutamyl-tRNA reductase [Isoptericola sp. b490]